MMPSYLSDKINNVANDLSKAFPESAIGVITTTSSVIQEALSEKNPGSIYLASLNQMSQDSQSKLFSSSLMNGYSLILAEPNATKGPRIMLNPKMVTSLLSDNNGKLRTIAAGDIGEVVFNGSNFQTPTIFATSTENKPPENTVTSPSEIGLEPTGSISSGNYLGGNVRTGTSKISDAQSKIPFLEPPTTRQTTEPRNMADVLRRIGFVIR